MGLSSKKTCLFVKLYLKLHLPNKLKAFFLKNINKMEDITKKSELYFLYFNWLGWSW